MVVLISREKRTRGTQHKKRLNALYNLVDQVKDIVSQVSKDIDEFIEELQEFPGELDAEY
jgi:hypothetical protein